MITVYDFRRALVAELMAHANVLATQNGFSGMRDLGEFRYQAGLANGFLQAADLVDRFLKQDQDENDE